MVSASWDKSSPEYSCNLGSEGKSKSFRLRGRLVKPTTLLKAVGVGYERAEFVIAHPVMPEAPKTRASMALFDSAEPIA